MRRAANYRHRECDRKPLTWLNQLTETMTLNIRCLSQPAQPPNEPLHLNDSIIGQSMLVPRSVTRGSFIEALAESCGTAPDGIRVYPIKLKRKSAVQKALCRNSFLTLRKSLLLWMSATGGLRIEKSSEKTEKS